MEVLLLLIPIIVLVVEWLFLRSVLLRLRNLVVLDLGCKRILIKEQIVVHGVEPEVHLGEALFSRSDVFTTQPAATLGLVGSRRPPLNLPLLQFLALALFLLVPLVVNVFNPVELVLIIVLVVDEVIYPLLRSALSLTYAARLLKRRVRSRPL